MLVAHCPSETSWAKPWRGYVEMFRDYLGIPAYDIEEIPADYDGIVINVGTHNWLGSERLNALAVKAAKWRHFVHIQDDWKGDLASQLKRVVKTKWSIITQIDHLYHMKRFEGVKRWWILDTNRWSYEPQPKLMDVNAAEDRLFYYGSFRGGRLGTLRKFPSMVISASKKTQPKYETIGFKDLIDRVEIPSGLAAYKRHLYAEDKDPNYPAHAPSNRFYECLSIGAPMFFATINPALLHEGLEVVGCEADVFKYDPEQVQQAQSRRWGRIDYRGGLLQQMQEVLDELRAS